MRASFHNEVAGNGNHLSFGDYGYSPRLGRRWNIDPLTNSFPSQSPYSFALNPPISLKDTEEEAPELTATKGVAVNKTVTYKNKTFDVKIRFVDNVATHINIVSPDKIIFS